MCLHIFNNENYSKLDEKHVKVCDFSQTYTVRGQKAAALSCVELDPVIRVFVSVFVWIYSFSSECLPVRPGHREQLICTSAQMWL